MNEKGKMNLNELINLAKQGNLDAANEILKMYNSKILYWVTKLIDEMGYHYRCSDELDDLMQIARTAFFESMYGYKENESSFLSYARVCVVNSIRNTFRTSRTNRELANYKSFSLDRRLDEEEDMNFLDLVRNNQPDFEGIYCMDDHNPKVIRERIKNDFDDIYADIYDLVSQGYKHSEIGEKLSINEKKVGYCLKNMRNFYNGTLTKKK